ncbi:uncharacterized protein LOC113275286 isoform X2 [Papaver somniferum]|uniref:uncharacterized protein LOC113275286 isoform X2 n=1 Tax=Papaver somniferum TaxID=3469 RepID=UPI000E6FC979|nr:uncharacterized protein LOC113275286 isoform X2 [Papaver somniferum]
MSTDSNMGYNHDAILASVLNNRHSISFQSGAVNSSSSSAEMIPMNTNSYGGVAGMSNVGNSGINLMNNNSNPGFVNSGLNSSGGGSLNYESVSGLNHDLELAVDWSLPEQTRLEEGLVRYADEPSIMRYIKIAALLPDKTVRDVALRCRWMTKENGKRRKQEEHYMGKKVKDRKEKFGESSSQLNLPPSPALNMSAYALMAHHMDQSDQISCEVLGSRTRHLLGENIQILSQIKANLETFKIHDNVNLFCHTRNNLAAILNNLRDMPGIMSQMPPLPVSVNEDLVNSILPHTAMFGSANGIYMKQEPRC